MERPSRRPRRKAASRGLVASGGLEEFVGEAGHDTVGWIIAATSEAKGERQVVTGARAVRGKMAGGRGSGRDPVCSASARDAGLRRRLRHRRRRRGRDACSMGRRLGESGKRPLVGQASTPTFLMVRFGSSAPKTAAPRGGDELGSSERSGPPDAKV